MKKIILLSMLFFIISQPVFAHILKTDGTIGAVLHTDPDDDPIIGKPTGFFFELKDKQGKFKLENCDCIFSISISGKEIFSQPLSQNASSSFIFSQKGSYQVKLTGKPNSLGLFAPFAVNFDLRVEHEAPSEKPSTFQLFSIGTIVLIILAIFTRVKNHI